MTATLREQLLRDLQPSSSGPMLAPERREAWAARLATMGPTRRREASEELAGLAYELNENLGGMGRGVIFDIAVLLHGGLPGLRSAEAAKPSSDRAVSSPQRDWTRAIGRVAV